MAVTIVTVRQGTYSGEWTINWSADADTAATITHNLGAVPNNIGFVPQNAATWTGQPVLTSIDANTCVVTKNAAVGSGGAALRVSLEVYHSIQR